MSAVWMPLYVGDYLKSTTHLTGAEHGAYLLLIMHYWQKGGLPADDKRLAIIARMTEAEWADSRETISEFFEPGWRHDRIDAELAKTAARAGAAKDAANRRWAEKAEKNADPMPTQCDGICDGICGTDASHIHPLSTSLRSEEREPRGAPSRTSVDFLRFWSAWPHKVGKPNALKSFRRVAGEIDAILAGVEAYRKAKPPDRPWLNPATFLNQRRWEDQPAPIAQLPLRTEPNGPNRSAHAASLRQLDAFRRGDDPFEVIRARFAVSDSGDGGG